MKHAYLIIAHNEFEILKRLIQALDDERNDIYIHFDRKLNHYPDCRTSYAKLTFFRGTYGCPLGRYKCSRCRICIVR